MTSTAMARKSTSYPALTTDADGTVWISWISCLEERDAVWLARHDGSGWSSPIQVSPENYADKLARFRKQLHEWTSLFGDRGEQPEFAMMHAMGLGGRYAKTEPVLIEIVRPLTSIASATPVRLTCPTEGVSVGYTTETGSNAHWALYSQPLTFEGTVRLRAKATRYGYYESDETKLDLP